MKVEKQYIELYSEALDMLNKHSAAPLNALRSAAFSSFKKIGLPTRKDERYKYTDVAKYFEPNYGLNLNRLSIPANPQEVFKCDVPDLDTVLAFLVNDAFYDKVEGLSSLPEGVILCGLKEAGEKYPELVSQYYGKLAKSETDGVTAFNPMFAQDGVFFYVPKNVVVEQPIQLINILRADVDLMANRRILIVLEEGAQAKFLVCNHAVDQVNFLTTQVTEIFAAANTHFDLYELEGTHNQTVKFQNNYVRQERESNVLVNNLTLYNGVSRTHTETALVGEGAEAHVNGMAILDKQQHVDNSSIIDHKVPHCQSNELFKYVLDDHAVGVFTGLVLVRPDAQHTLSEQTNRNLCLTPDARMYTRPQLEIYADDVRCSHGATVGQLDEEALFYMRTRGIAAHEAKLLLMFAFVNEVIDTIRIEPLKERLHTLVEKRFRGELSKCTGCAKCR